MPLYEYVCSNCGHKYEKIQKFTDMPEKTCPVCCNDSLTRPMACSTFFFKGNGWYVTDYHGK
jgi:putative FmdB family regulatory protein